MKKVKNITVITKLLDVNKKKWNVVIFSNEKHQRI
jgi:hypothetical protein